VFSGLGQDKKGSIGKIRQAGFYIVGFAKAFLPGAEGLLLDRFGSIVVEVNYFRHAGLPFRYKVEEV
jgi:hypothetical protein